MTGCLIVRTTVGRPLLHAGFDPDAPHTDPGIWRGGECACPTRELEDLSAAQLRAALMTSEAIRERQDADLRGLLETGTRTAAQERAAAVDRLIADLQSQAGRADSQAATLLATAGIVVGVVTGRWTPHHHPVAALVVWWAGVALAAAALGLFAAAIRPRIPRITRPPAAVHHAWDVLAADRAGTLPAALDRTAAGDDAEHRRQLLAVARIVNRKFRAVRNGLHALAAAGVLLTLAAVLSGGVR